MYPVNVAPISQQWHQMIILRYFKIYQSTVIHIQWYLPKSTVVILFFFWTCTMLILRITMLLAQNTMVELNYSTWCNIVHVYKQV